MQLKEKQQEIQLERDNELRQLIGDYIANCYKINQMIKSLNRSKDKLEKLSKIDSYEERIKMAKEAKSIIESFAPNKVDKILMELTKIHSQIQMYLFNDDSYSNAVLIALQRMTEKLLKLDPDNMMELNGIVDSAKSYFQHQWIVTDKLVK